MHFNTLIPELYCSSITDSLHFYTEILGFNTVYSRFDERFSFLEREGAQLMIEQSTQADRTWLVGELQRPFGRGINIQIKTSTIKELYTKCLSAKVPIYLKLEEKWYPVKDQMLGCLQFIVLDPDGYMLRFSEFIAPK